MKMGYAILEDAILSALRMDDGERLVVRSRVQYLQASGFLEGGGRGRGHRAEYSDRDLLLTAAALTLVQTGCALKAAAATVSQNWSTFADVAESGETDGKPNRIAVTIREGAETLAVRSMTPISAIELIFAADAGRAPAAVVMDFRTVAQTALAKAQLLSGR